VTGSTSSKPPQKELFPDLTGDRHQAGTVTVTKSEHLPVLALCVPRISS
jgi:hypothetical protein